MSQLLEQQVEEARQSKWSIIPLEGSGENAKRPAQSIGRWSKYQEKPATPAEIKQWIKKGLEAYGIIMGAVSGGISAIDFDCVQTYKNFCERFPTISKTYTVQTRKGYHVYLRIPVAIKTARFDGGDIIGEGSYVVGAGSTIRQTIDGKQVNTQYRLLGNAEIQNISVEEWYNVQEHLGIMTANIVQVPPRNTAKITKPELLIAQYEKHSQEDGRNKALYSVAVQAKRHNMNQTDIIATLAHYHAQAPARDDHPAESYQQRYTEALRTIQSAYNTTGNNVLQPYEIAETSNTRQLPNSLREALLRATARKSEAGNYIETAAATARLIEGLYREGYLATIASNTAIGEIATRYKISHSTLKKILAGDYNGVKLLREVSHSQPKNKPPVGEGERKNKNQIFYSIPSLEDLLKRFQVVPQAADILSDDDLRSNKAYLQALHREFVKRRGGDCSTAYCAARLSVTTRTILNYDKDLKIIKTAVVEYEGLAWHNVDDIDFPVQDEKGITPGLWIQRADGKRFPAIKGIALEQLKAGATLIICKQKPSVRYLPNAALIYHEVWWVAPDGSRWGGAADAFPPEATTIYTSPAPIEPITQAIILPKRQRIDDSEMVQAYYRATFEERDRQRVVHIVEQVQQARQTQTFTVEAHINESLQMIKGIGAAVHRQLNLAGIEHMTDLIGLDAETIATIFRYNRYISAKTTQNWIDQAERLLGLRQVTQEELEQEAQAKEYQEQIRRYKHAYQHLQSFIADLLNNDEHANLVLQNFQRRLALWTEHPQIFTFIKFDEVKTRVLDELDAHLAHIQTFLNADEAWLARWNFGTSKHWRKRAEQVNKQLQVWQRLALN